MVFIVCLLCASGSNGQEYMFLLKGHEDLRQDERVMYVFTWCLLCVYCVLQEVTVRSTCSC